MTPRARIWFLLSFFSTMFLMLAFATNCGGDPLVTAENVREAVMPGDCGEESATDFHSTRLCMDRYGTPPGEVWLTPETAEADCSADHEMRTFEVFEEFPITVVLDGYPEVNYCMEVYRTSGYITISHEEGRVTRDGKLFMWCVEIGEESSVMIVRSLTARSTFELLVP